MFDVSDPQNPFQLYELTADDAANQDIFGISVGVSGDMAIVGARGNDDAGNASGSVYLFDVTTGQQLHKLTANDAAAFDRFGYAAA
ncbi:MAG: FG-GAP repeat protein, partial [Planctomycetota bacterium]